MFKTDHDHAAICRIAVYQKIVFGFLLLYAVAIVCSFTLPDDLRPMVGYLMLPMALLASVFLFLLAFQVFGVRIGMALLAINLLVLGASIFGGETFASAPPPRPTQLDDKEADEILKEFKRQLAKLEFDTSAHDPDMYDPPTDEERARLRKALAQREEIKTEAVDETETTSGLGLIWALLVNLIILVVVNARAASILRQRGVSMGLLGPHLPDLLPKETKS